MSDANIKIDGMSCQHCVMSVRKALEGLDGVSDCSVEVGGAEVKFDESSVSLEEIRAAIVKAGYKVGG